MLCWGWLILRALTPRAQLSQGESVYGEGVFLQRPSVVSLRCAGAGFESTLCPRLPAVPLPLLCLWSLPCAVLICHALLWEGPVHRCPQAHCRRSGVCVCLQLRGGGVARELSLGCRSPWGECLSLFSRLSGAPWGAEGSPRPWAHSLSPAPLWPRALSWPPHSCHLLLPSSWALGFGGRRMCFLGYCPAFVAPRGEAGRPWRPCLYWGAPSPCRALKCTVLFPCVGQRNPGPGRARGRLELGRGWPGDRLWLQM